MIAGVKCLDSKDEPGARCLTVRNMLECRLLKLSAANANKRILLLERDSVTGAIESDTHVFEMMPGSRACEVMSMKSGPHLRLS
jgi:hypothetical protein